MDAFVINLAGAAERWSYMQQVLGETGFTIIRVEAVDGSKLDAQPAGYDEASFHRRHGRTTNLREVGCYQSHLKAWEMFLASGDTHALFCEDDVSLCTGALEAIRSLLARALQWDVVRLSGLKAPPGIAVGELSKGYTMKINFGRLKGAGAYLLNRRAAQRMVRRLSPMRVPFDHAVDREWFYGLTGVSVAPFPIDQTGARFRTSIQRGPAAHLPWVRRMGSTYPYQVVNEVARFFGRGVCLIRAMMRRCGEAA